MQRHVTAGGKHRTRPLAEAAGKGVHGQVVAQQKSLKTDATAHDALDDRGRARGRRRAVHRLVDHVRRHRPRHVGEGMERREVDRLQLGQWGVHRR